MVSEPLRHRRLKSIHFMDRDEVMKHEPYMIESIVSTHEQLVYMKLKHLVEKVRENTKNTSD